MNNKQISATLLSAGMLTLLITAALPLAGIQHPWLRYIYAVGAALTLVARFFEKYTGNNLAIKRLFRIQTVSSVCYCASAALLFYSGGEKDWLAFLTSGAVLQIYTAFRIQHEEAKEAKKNDKK